MPDISTAAEDRARVDEFLTRFGKERNLSLEPLDDEGVARIQRGSAVVSIHVVSEQGVLLLLSKVMDLPDTRREELYRRLLELSFLATGDAAFAINKQTDEVYLRCLRRLEGLDYDEFEDLVHTVATVADDWDDALQRDFT
jgi:hypothetical protein